MTLRICRLMRILPSEFGDRVTLDDFEWLTADYLVDPWGEERADLSRAIAAAATLQGWGSETTADKLMIDYGTEPMSPEDKMRLDVQKLRASARAINARIERTQRVEERRE